MNINPQGYEYGKEPVNKNPFWDDVDIFDQYVKDIQLTVDEGSESNNFKISYTNQDNEVVELPVEILYMTPDQIKNKIPSEYIKTIGLAVTEGDEYNTAELSFKNQDNITVGVAPIIKYMTPEQVKDLIGQDIPIEYIKSMNIYATDLEDGTRGFNLHIEYTPNGQDEPTSMDFHLMTNTDIINAINQAKTEVQGEIPTQYIKDVVVSSTQGADTTKTFTFTMADNTTKQSEINYLSPEQVDTKIQAAKTELQGEIPTEYIQNVEVEHSIPIAIGKPQYTKIDFYKTYNGQERSLIDTLNIYNIDQIEPPVRRAMGKNHNVNSVYTDAVSESPETGKLTSSIIRFFEKVWETNGQLSSPRQIDSIQYAKPEDITAYINERLEDVNPYPYTKSVGGNATSDDNGLTNQITINYAQQQSKTSSAVIPAYSWTNYTKEGIQDLINKTISGRVAQIKTKTSTTTRASGLKESKLEIQVYGYVDGKPSIGYTPINISYVKPEDLEAYVDSKLGGA